MKEHFGECSNSLLIPVEGKEIGNNRTLETRDQMMILTGYLDNAIDKRVADTGRDLRQ